MAIQPRPAVPTVAGSPRPDRLRVVSKTAAGNGHRDRGGRGTPLVLLHGLGGTWRVWQPLLPSLQARHDVLALTLPGHQGVPLDTNAPVTAARLADAIESSLDHEGIGAAHVAGNSLGGWLALELARRRRALTVVAIAPIGLLTTDDVARLASRLLAQHALAARIRPLARLLASSSAGRRLLFGHVVRHPGALPSEHAVQWLDAFVECTGFAAILDGLAAHPPDALPSDLACPVSVVWPAEDRLTPASPHAERFLAALPGARHVRLPSAGHTPMFDAPQAVAAIVLEQTRAVDGVARTPA
jgi:pimeloyl-ACP methyl ester carboxylesterase